MELKNYIPWPRISAFPAQEGARGKRALGKGVLDKKGSASEGSVRGSYPRRSWAKGGGGGEWVKGGRGGGKPFATFSKTFPFKEVSLLQNSRCARRFVRTR